MSSPPVSSLFLAQPRIALDTKPIVSFTIAQKIEVGHVLQLGNPNHAVIHQFNISERTVRNIKRSLPSIRRHLTKSTTTLGTKTLHLAHYPKLEAYLLDFRSFARAGKNAREKLRLVMLAIRYNILESDWNRLLVKECWMGLRSTMSVKILRGGSYRMQ